jgi:Mor family transcriptional regulator
MEVTMSNKKQTSVDFLFERLWNTPKDKWEWNAVLKEVKEMHKQEMKDAALNDVTKNAGLRKIFEKQFEEYYTNTFE